MQNTGGHRKPVRAAIVGTGLLAKHLYSYSSQDDVDIVAIGSSSSDKLGLKASEVLGCPGPDITIQGTTEILDSGDIDVVLHAGPQESVWAAFEQCAARGIDIVTSAGGFFVSEDPAEGRRELEIVGLAEQTGARLLGTGIFPGFTPDFLPIALSRILPGPVSISVKLVSDITPWSESVLRNEIGIGGPRHDAELTLFNYVKASARLIAQSIVSDRTDWTYRSEFLTSPDPLKLGAIDVAPGTVAGFSLRAVATLDACTVDVTWQSALGDTEPGGFVTVSSPEHELSIQASIRGVPAYPATAARLLNSVRPLQTMPAGLRSAFELPIAVQVRPKHCAVL